MLAPVRRGAVFGGDDGDEKPQPRHLRRHRVDVLREQLARDYAARHGGVALGCAELSQRPPHGERAQEGELARTDRRVVYGELADARD